MGVPTINLVLIHFGGIHVKTCKVRFIGYVLRTNFFPSQPTLLERAYNDASNELLHDEKAKLSSHRFSEKTNFLLCP